MTVIASAGRDNVLERGIQPFDARRHLRQVADLIGAVFASELDENGRSALQEMQTIGRWSPVLGTLLSTAFLSDFVAGYVWVEGGEVIGNVTLQRQEESGTRWRISNVAVQEKYRGRGIARLLMLATLRDIARRGGSWAVLQVRVDNPPARRLYERLGFANVCQDGIWYAPALPAAQAVDGAAVRPLARRDWRARFELAQASRPALAHWAEPIQADAFRPTLVGDFRRAVGAITGLQQTHQWGIWASDAGADYLAGEVEAVANGIGEAHRLGLAMLPGAPDGTAEALVAQGLAALRSAPPHPVVVTYSGDAPAVIRAIESAGFAPRRVLVTMRRLMTPADAQVAIPGLD